MPTALYPEYITIGGVHFGSKAREIYDWQELLGSSPKRGQDVTVPGVAGDIPRARVASAHRALLRLRINGEYSHDNVSLSATLNGRVEGAYTQYKIAKAVADVNTVQTLQLVRPAGTSSEDAIVLGFTPTGRLNPWVWEFVLDVKLPDGPMAIT